MSKSKGIIFLLVLVMLSPVSCSNRANQPVIEVEPTAVVIPTPTVEPTATSIPIVAIPSGPLCDFISEPLLKKVLGKELEIGDSNNSSVEGSRTCFYSLNSYSNEISYYLFIKRLRGRWGDVSYCENTKDFVLQNPNQDIAVLSLRL